jgi:hypothetical protein
MNARPLGIGQSRYNRIRGAMASSNNGGGAFLSALKEKNEKQRLAKLQSKPSLPQQQRKSFFGSLSFFSSSGKKDGSFGAEGAKAAMEEASSEETTVRIEATAIETRARTKASDTAVIVEQTSVSYQEIVARGPASPSTPRDANGGVREQSREAYSDSTHVIRGVASMSVIESETPSVAPRQRRASTTVESSSSRRMSSEGGPVEIQHRDSQVRERTTSIATMSEVYGRAGRDPRMFEMSNPLLDDASKGRRREHSVTATPADLEHDNKKRASLYQSASHHVDQTLLLERRNTRTGRSPSMDGGPSSAAPLSPSNQHRRSMVEVAEPVVNVEG